MNIYLGSQWMILKSNARRVTNMSGSSRTSCTVGGGKAMAMAIIPSRGTGWLWPGAPLFGCPTPDLLAVYA